MSDLTVLIPLDGSKAAEKALALLPAMQPLGPLRVRLLSVAEADEDVKAEERHEKLLADYLDDVGQRVERRGDFMLDCVRRTGMPYLEILEEAARQDVNLILMTTHGKTSGEPERLGSVVDKVVRGASCPTLLVGPRASVPGEIAHITVPLDGSPLAAEALPVAQALINRLNSSLRLVQAVQYPAVLESDLSAASSSGAADPLTLSAESYLREATSKLETSQPVETAVLNGPPAAALMNDLEEHRPDLVIMTSHGRTGYIKWALGGVTDRLIRGPVPVLVLRPVGEVGQRLQPLMNA